MICRRQQLITFSKPKQKNSIIFIIRFQCFCFPVLYFSFIVLNTMKLIFLRYINLIFLIMSCSSISNWKKYINKESWCGQNSLITFLSRPSCLLSYSTVLCCIFLSLVFLCHFLCLPLLLLYHHQLPYCFFHFLSPQFFILSLSPILPYRFLTFSLTILLIIF